MKEKVSKTKSLDEAKLFWDIMIFVVLVIAIVIVVMSYRDYYKKKPENPKNPTKIALRLNQTQNKLQVFGAYIFSFCFRSSTISFRLPSKITERL